jgi:N-acetylglucosamine-6-phosphate deacetylase
MNHNHLSSSILIEDGLISKVLPSRPDTITDVDIIDAHNQLVIPGMIDIHVHGAWGSDTMDDVDDESIKRMSRFFASKGVTGFLPTTVAASQNDILKSIERINGFNDWTDGSRVLGIHLEGPYLDHQFRGAQPEQHLRPAKAGEYLPWLETGMVKLMTVAPEIEGVLDLIETGQKFGVRFAVGHSKANFEQVTRAIDLGLTQVTHIFNGMPSIHHREPGILGAVLTDERVFVQMIADGIHIHPAIIKLIMRAKGVNKTVLITDSISATGMHDGHYKLGDQIVDVKDGIARTSSGSLAGSTLSMDKAILNTMNYTNLPFDEVLLSATKVAAESVGIDDRFGKIQSGYHADLVILDDKFTPQLTIINGKVVYDSQNRN